MAVFLGAIRNKIESLDYFHQSVLGVMKKEVKKFTTKQLRSALRDLKEARAKFGNKKTTTKEDLYNEAQQEIIKSEINSRK